MNKQNFSPRRLVQAFGIMLISGTASIAFASSGDVVLYAAKAPIRSGTWSVVPDSTAASGYAMANPDLGLPTLTVPLAQPKNYFQLNFPAYSGTAYHLWVRAHAAQNSLKNDSVFVQFSDSVTRSGSANYRIGTTSAMTVVLQSCTSSPVHGWGWTDNGWCDLGANIFFQNTGKHAIRIQVRQDGLSIDQIVLSPRTYISSSPGKTINDTTILTATVPLITTIQVSESAIPSSGVSPLTVSFTPQVKVSSGSIARYFWQFGDGQTSTATAPTHLYESNGSYSAKLTVSDSDGTQASTSVLITVSGSNTFSDTFNTGSLDASKWFASNGSAPGSISGVNYGSFEPSNIDLSKGMLCLKLQQQLSNIGVLSIGGEIQSITTYGYGTYEWVMRASSTSQTPTGAGSAVSGQISAGFSFVNNSQTEIDFEIEGQNPDTVWMTNWISTTEKQYSSVFLASPDTTFHQYKFVWMPGRIDFYIDGALVSSHTSNVPSAPAYVMINHWGTNSTGWGGLASIGVERYLYVSSFTYTPL